MLFFQTLILSLSLLVGGFSLPYAVAKKKSVSATKKRFLHNLRAKQICRTPKTEDKSPTLEPNKTVLLIKQWHLPPTTITKGFKERYPHETNQSAIYRYLNERVRTHYVDMIVGEGCQGEIDENFAVKFNGWDLESLRKISQQKNFDRVLTHIPLKIEARHQDGIRTFCADDESLIQEGNLRLSNLKGWLGYLSRLSDDQADKDKLALYSESASNLLKIEKEIAIPDLLKLIREKMREELNAFKKSIEERNQVVVKTLNEQSFTRAALVIGGLHAKDLQNKLELAGFDCEVLEPPGYGEEDEKLFQEFSRALE
jgi:hypothetical protein